ncbi:MAG TPA: Gfo/Idh/MocA family oxidoreductase [Chloroflexota bacterium]|jgi:predicted dehydrogenase|nr:Gfo/Idh/MocA family oxidoreductase [Chloroflexota bacterium]
MSTKKLGVGVIGLGWVAGEHIRAWQKNPNVEIVALSSASRENAEAVRDRHGIASPRIHTDWADLIRDQRVDLVDICSMNHLHVPQGIAGAEAKKHLLIEKPAAIDLEGLRRLEAAIDRAGVKSLVGFELHWSPFFESIHRMIEADFFGKIHYAEVDYFSGNQEKWYQGYQWVRTRQKGGSALAAAGCHAVDAIRQFVRSDAVEVFGYAGNFTKVMEYDATILSSIRFADGTIGKVGCSLEGNLKYRFNVRLHGDKGTLVDDTFLTHHLPGQTDYAQFPTITPNTPDVTHHPFQGELDHLVDCILQDRTPIVDIKDAVKTHELMFAAEQSAREGKPVRLPLPR